MEKSDHGGGYPHRLKSSLKNPLVLSLSKDERPDRHRSWFDRALLSRVEGLTTNGINNLPFVLSLSKDLFSVSLIESPGYFHAPHLTAATVPAPYANIAKPITANKPASVSGM